MPTNVFDKACRFVAQLDPPAFLGWLLGLPPDGFAFRRWLETRGIPFPGDADRTNDTVASLDDPVEHGVPWAVAVEFQTRPDPDMFGRMLGYLSGLWLGLRPDEERGSRFRVGAAVVNLTGVGSASREFGWPGTPLKTHLGVIERNLEREDAGELVAGIESGRSRCLLPWVPLMAGADAPALVDRWKALAEGEPDPARRKNYAAVAVIFAGRVGRKELWGPKLEGWNVEESTVLNEWIAKAEKKAEARGEERGEARGEARGIAVGETNGRATSLLELLTERFGTVPEEVATTIRGTTDIERLRAWLRAAAVATDLPAFRLHAGI